MSLPGIPSDSQTPTVGMSVVIPCLNEERSIGILHSPRELIFWTLWLLLDVQICFSAFFLSMNGVSRGIWIGDRK